MESVLHIKNFGAIKDVTLNLKSVNVFIGEQATGKSAIAKLYTILKSPRKFITTRQDKITENIPDEGSFTTDNFIETLKDYNIDSFLEKGTEITFKSELHEIVFKNNSLTYTPKLLQKVNSLKSSMTDFEANRNQIFSEFKDLCHNFILFDLTATNQLVKEKRIALGTPLFSRTDDLTKVNSEDCKNLINVIEDIEKDLSTKAALYIPAERIISNIIKKSALNLILNNVPIPKHILQFGAELEKSSLNEIDLSFIKKELKYKNINGEDKIFIGDDKNILLTESASGIQSVVPILSSILSNINIKHHSFVIEEPELNLFPTAQYNLIQFLEENRSDFSDFWEDVGTIHTYTTHSPYILSSFNNLLYAHKVMNKLHYKIEESSSNKRETEKEEINNTIKKIVKATINPNFFTAYQIYDGYAESIFDDQAGLIKENFIDKATDKINDDFDALMELENE